MRRTSCSSTAPARSRPRSSRRARDRRGTSAIEYALLLSFVSIGAIAAVQHVGEAASAVFDDTATILSGINNSDGETGSSSDSSSGYGNVKRPGSTYQDKKRDSRDRRSYKKPSKSRGKKVYDKHRNRYHGKLPKGPGKKSYEDPRKKQGKRYR